MTDHADTIRPNGRRIAAELQERAGFMVQSYEDSLAVIIDSEIAVKVGAIIASVLGAYKWGSRHYKPAHDRDRPRVDSLHSWTPPAFRDVLLDMARSAALAGLEEQPQ